MYQGDKMKAQAALERARPVAEQRVREAPDDGLVTQSCSFLRA